MKSIGPRDDSTPMSTRIRDIANYFQQIRNMSAVTTGRLASNVVVCEPSMNFRQTSADCDFLKEHQKEHVFKGTWQGETLP